MLRVLLLIKCLLVFQPVYAAEKIVIPQWLSTPAVPVQLPAFHEEENTRGEAFSPRRLLMFEHLDLHDLYPEEGMSFTWPGSGRHTWEVFPGDENGYVHIPGATPGEWQAAWLATYIRADRFMHTKLEISSPYLFELWVNGERKGTKSSVETAGETMGRISQELKLPRGNHLVIIKALKPAEEQEEGKENAEWQVRATLGLEEPFAVNELQPHVSPANTKNIMHIMDGVKVTGLSASPDGRMMAVRYRQSLPPSDQSENWTEIRRSADGQLLHSFRHARVSRLNWLPATNAVSYTTVRDGKTSIHYHHMETGEQRLIARDIERLGMLRWAPDESFIIYSVNEPGEGTGDDMRHILGMRDRVPGFRDRSFLYKLDMTTGGRTRLTHGHLTTALMDISPDGRFLLFSQSRPDYQERPYGKQDVFLLHLGSLQVDTLLADQRWGISARFSPDGSRLLATGGPSAFDGAGTATPPDLIPNNYDTQAYIYHLGSGEVECITLDFDPSVSSVHWQASDGNIYIQATEQDRMRIFRYEPNRKRFTRLETGVDFASGMGFANRAHTMTFVGNQVNRPPKAYVMDLRNQRVSVVEDTESENYRHVRFGEVHDWDFVASSGVKVTGRYYLPPDFDPEKKYPVIVYYYGGMSPVSRSFGGRYPFNLWAGHGYVVYVLQPSGAIGFGQEFAAAHVNNWGITVADEIIEGTQRFLEAHPFTDASRVGCAGASYGGFMTMLLMTRTDMFAAAISHAGISSISSYWGTGFWGYGYSAEATANSFPWNNKDIYVGQSPLFHADRIHTPLLLITGDSDTNVPPGESMQLYTALKILGRPVELVLVKGEDHHIVTYGKRILWHNTLMAWWDKYLKDQPEWWQEQYPEKNY